MIKRPEILAPAGDMESLRAALNYGADAVSKGEILYTRKERNQEYSESERKVCYHPAKGFINALIGTLPILIPALILAFRTTVLTTEAGTLPSWMQAYAGRSEIGDALINYTQPEAMDAVDYIRAFIRICIMPFVNVIGHDSKNGMYGFGYMSGRNIRTRIHTVISENDKNRIRKERKRIRKQNTQARRREPEQLN